MKAPRRHIGFSCCCDVHEPKPYRDCRAAMVGGAVADLDERDILHLECGPDEQLGRPNRKASPGCVSAEPVADVQTAGSDPAVKRAPSHQLLADFDRVDGPFSRFPVSPPVSKQAQAALG